VVSYKCICYHIGFVMFKCSALLSIVFSLLVCCVNAEDESSGDNKKTNSKNVKDKNAIKLRKEDIKKLHDFLEEEYKKVPNNEEKNKKNIKIIIENINQADKILDIIINGNYKHNKEQLEIEIRNLNIKIEQIKKLYIDLFSFIDNDKKNKKKSNNTNRVIKLPSKKIKVQAITSNNCPYSTRKECLSVKPLSEEAIKIDEETNDQKPYVVIDLNGITPEQVQDYYNDQINNDDTLKNNDSVPVEGIIQDKSSDNETGNKPINELPN